MNPSELIKIRKSLNLYDGWWNDLNDDLLTLAFIPKNSTIELPDYIYKKYGFRNYELLEFFGDSVLEVIVSMIVFKELTIGQTNVNQDKLKFFRREMVRNSTLYCHGIRKNICEFLKKDNITIKECADVLEAIIGILYYYLYYLKNIDYAISILYDWYVHNFYIDESICYLKNLGTLQYSSNCDNNSPINTCLNLCQPKQLLPCKKSMKFEDEEDRPRKPVNITKSINYEKILNIPQEPIKIVKKISLKKVPIKNVSQKVVTEKISCDEINTKKLMNVGNLTTKEAIKILKEFNL